MKPRREIANNACTTLPPRPRMALPVSQCRAQQLALQLIGKSHRPANSVFRFRVSTEPLTLPIAGVQRSLTYRGRALSSSAISTRLAGTPTKPEKILARSMTEQPPLALLCSCSPAMAQRRHPLISQSTASHLELAPQMHRRVVPARVEPSVELWEVKQPKTARWRARRLAVQTVSST